MHVPGWHEATERWQAAGDLQLVGIVQEQHPDRARLFMQWKQMDWPILVDSLDLLETTVVPMTLLIDEHGVIRRVQPPRDDLEAVRREFLEVAFDPPNADPRLHETVPDGRAASMRPQPDEARTAVATYLWERDGDPDAVIRAFERAISAEPEHGYALFRAGVAYRWRHDSPAARPGDFQRAVDYWERALSIDPNNYIWRRRIQQYGPRLSKPYPFYDWVVTARQEIRARGEEPVPLVVEPGGAELAGPQDTFTAAGTDIEPPLLDDRIYGDEGEFVSVEATVVPRTIEPGASFRAHVEFVPNEAIKAHWNNEVDDLIFWIEPPRGWQVDRRVITVPNPPETVSAETRRVELEIKVPDDAAGRYELPGYALYYVCEDVNGICLYRRQDVFLSVRVRR